MIKRFKEALKFDNLVVEYKVLLKVNAATAAAEFVKMFEVLLDALLAEVEDIGKEVDKLHNTLVSDKVTRLTHIDKYYNGYKPDADVRLAMVELMRPVIVSRRPVVNTATDKVVDKDYWKYDEADLVLIEDHDRLSKLCNVYSSTISKERSLEIAAEYYGLSTEDTKAKLAALRTFARARQKELGAPKISSALANKLSKDGKATLSAAEVAELRKLLG